MREKEWKAGPLQKLRNVFNFIFFAAPSSLLLLFLHPGPQECVEIAAWPWEEQECPEFPEPTFQTLPQTPPCWAIQSSWGQSWNLSCLKSSMRSWGRGCEMGKFHPGIAGMSLDGGWGFSSLSSWTPSLLCFVFLGEKGEEKLPRESSRGNFQFQKSKTGFQLRNSNNVKIMWKQIYFL